MPHLINDRERYLKSPTLTHVDKPTESRIRRSLILPVMSKLGLLRLSMMVVLSMGWSQAHADELSEPVEQMLHASDIASRWVLSEMVVSNLNERVETAFVLSERGGRNARYHINLMCGQAEAWVTGMQKRAGSAIIRQPAHRRYLVRPDRLSPEAYRMLRQNAEVVRACESTAQNVG